LAAAAADLAAAVPRDDGKETLPMNFKRLTRHLLTTPRRVKRAFPNSALVAIEQAIQRSEAQHSGQIRFAVEGALDGRPLFRGQPASERAVDMFSQLRVWDTAHNNGVLIYLLLADRDVEIVADRGVHARVGAAEWERICRVMEADFGRGDFAGGVIKGIAAVGEHLVRHFPATGNPHNELPNEAVVM